MKLSIRETAIFGVIASLMYASKVIMEFLPNIHLIGTFVIALTVTYRKKALYPIYTFVGICGLFSGFATWWIPYLYIWLILWAVVMVLPRNINPKIKPVIYMSICAMHGFLYGILYAPVHIIIYRLSFRGAIAWVVAGLPWDFVHGVGNFFCGTLICPVIRALRLGENQVK